VHFIFFLSLGVLRDWPTFSWVCPPLPSSTLVPPVNSSLRLGVDETAYCSFPSRPTKPFLLFLVSSVLDSLFPFAAFPPRGDVQTPFPFEPIVFFPSSMSRLVPTVARLDCSSYPLHIPTLPPCCISPFSVLPFPSCFLPTPRTLCHHPKLPLLESPCPPFFFPQLLFFLGLTKFPLPPCPTFCYLFLFLLYFPPYLDC